MDIMYLKIELLGLKAYPVNIFLFGLGNYFFNIFFRLYQKGLNVTKTILPICAQTKVNHSVLALLLIEYVCIN